MDDLIKETKNSMKNFLKNKSILITGGTRSFGQKFLEKIISTDFKQIRILSRDEKKQEDLRNKINNSRLNFISEMLEIKIVL